MSVKRKLAKIETPPAHYGFLGAGHTAPCDYSKQLWGKRSLHYVNGRPAR